MVNLCAAAAGAGIVLSACFAGAGPLPPLGEAFNPGTGAWTMAADARLPSPATLRLAGLRRPARVLFESDGTAHITATGTHDAFLATGYVHARFRLFQMDLLRRQGEGLLSQVVGPAALAGDRFELQLGLLRTAELEWPQLGAASRDALTAYAQGVNDRIQEDERTGGLPALFKLLAYRPTAWTPIDTLIVKGDMTQDLDFTTGPLDYALLVKGLGRSRAMSWFPVLPPNAQSPYDPGPYLKAPPEPIPPLPEAVPAQNVSPPEARAAAALLAVAAALPGGEIARGGNSNNWAVGGARTAAGGALLANDPHLQLTLPSIWFQIAIDAPGYHASGAGIPGTPVVLIGHNRRIAWGLTDTQNQATLYYHETTDAAHPGTYLWNGAWTPFGKAGYRIPVLGRAPVPLNVELTVHGPVMTQKGQTMSVWWAGNLPSDDLGVMLAIGASGSWDEFRTALAGWHAPSQNFAYADRAGNVGMISAGYYPQVARGDPWLPLPGTGAYDVTGTIPYAEVPQVYDPPRHVLWSANQRPVGPDYPYYIGTTLDFDPGYRANEIHRVLGGSDTLGEADMEALQNDVRDSLAAEIVPRLLTALQGSQLTPQQHVAESILAGWNDRMDTGSAAAAIWWTFWNAYLTDTFQPWWSARHVGLPRTDFDSPLGMELDAWTLGDPGNPAFSLPSGAHRSAADVMVRAFADALDSLTRRLGRDPAAWTWGRIHTRALESLAEIASLGYGPRPDRGDSFTPDAAGGEPSVHGPSWRMVVDWGGAAVASYPGGQSENPASAWYADRIDRWWNGRYSPMTQTPLAGTEAGSVAWEMRP